MSLLKIVLILLLPYYSFASSHHPEEFLQAIKGARNEGEQIVDHYCANCHAEKPLINLGAPRSQYKEDWEGRVTKRWETLWTHTTEGINAMPARGGCFECSDKQLYLAIMALLPPEMKKSLLKDHK